MHERMLWSAQERGRVSADTLGTGKGAWTPSSWPAVGGSTMGSAALMVVKAVAARPDRPGREF